MLNTQIQELLLEIPETSSVEDSFVQILSQLSGSLTSLPHITAQTELPNATEPSTLLKLTARVIDVHEIDYFGGLISDKSTGEFKVYIFGDDDRLEQEYNNTKDSLDWDNPMLITRRLLKCRFLQTQNEQSEDLAKASDQDFFVAIFSNHDDIKLNHVYTFTGEYVPLKKVDSKNSDSMIEEKLEPKQPESEEIEENQPVQKVLNFSATPFQNYYGLYELPKKFEMISEKMSANQKWEIKKLSETLTIVINSVLKDSLVSKLLLMSLASSGVKKFDQDPVDIMNLNIFGINDREIVKQIESFLGLIVPHLQKTIQTTTNLNMGRFYDSKDFEKNDIVKGTCDVHTGSFLMIDELLIGEGKQFEVGVKNIHFLNDLISQQIYNIDYQYNQVKTEISCPIVSFSKDKSILSFSNKVPYKKTSEGEDKQVQFEDLDMDLSGWTSFLIYCKDLAENFQLLEDCKKLIIDDFVELKNDKVFTNWDDLKYLMCLAKYLSIFNGDANITFSSYSEAKEILIEIQMRLNEIEGAKTSVKKLKV